MPGTLRSEVSSAVIALGAVDHAAAARRVRALPGVLGVTSDPCRKQLVVRYDAAMTSESLLRRSLWPRFDGHRWTEVLPAWPRLALALDLAADAVAG